jgi:hypothetical protein
MKKERAPLKVGDRVKITGYGGMDKGLYHINFNDCRGSIEEIVGDRIKVSITSNSGELFHYWVHRRNIVSRIVKKPKREPRRIRIWVTNFVLSKFDNPESLIGKTTYAIISQEKIADDDIEFVEVLK